MNNSRSGRKILVLNYEFPPIGGGASPVSYEITKRYAAAGYDVDVVTMGFQNLPAFEQKDGINIYRVKSFRKTRTVSSFREQLAYLLSAFWLLRRLMRKNTYLFCHCHFLVPTGILAITLKRIYRLRYIVTSHGSDVPGHNIDRFKILHYFTRPIIRRIIRQADCVTTPSIYLKSLIERNVFNNQPLDVIITIPNGSRSMWLPNVEKENVIISVGRMQPMKGFQYLIRAFRELRLDNWRLYLIGEGRYRPELERLAGGEPNIIFTGWLDTDDKRFIELYNRAKIFALLSQKESQGIVYIEAMSAGCALLASDYGAIKETVTSEVGCLVNPTDTLIIKSKLLEMTNNPQAIKQYSANSKERYLNHFTWEKVIKSYLSLIRRYYG